MERVVVGAPCLATDGDVPPSLFNYIHPVLEFLLVCPVRPRVFVSSLTSYRSLDPPFPSRPPKSGVGAELSGRQSP